MQPIPGLTPGRNCHRIAFYEWCLCRPAVIYLLAAGRITDYDSEAEEII